MKKTLLVTMDYLPATGGIAVFWSELQKYLPADKFLILAPSLTGRQDITHPVLRRNVGGHLSYPFANAREDRQEGITPPKSPPKIGGEIKGGYDSGPNLIRIKFFNKWIWPHWLPLLIKLSRIIRQQSIELVIAGQILPVGTVCYLLKMVGLLNKYQVSCHGMDLAVLKGRKRKLAKTILTRADKVVVNSDFTRQLVVNLGVRESKVYKVRPCPRQLLPANMGVLSSYNLNTDKVILSVARLVERKGIAEVIKDMPRVWQTMPEAVYLIVGEGPDRARLNRVVKEKIPAKYRNKIVFCGRVPDRELAAYYQAARIFILPVKPSNNDVEGFGIVYLEAGLFKLPVIASPVGGVKEAVKAEETGIFVNNEDGAKMAAAIIKLLNDDEYRLRLGNNNYHWAKSFNWRQEAKTLENNL